MTTVSKKPMAQPLAPVAKDQFVVAWSGNGGVRWFPWVTEQRDEIIYSYSHDSAMVVEEWILLRYPAVLTVKVIPITHKAVSVNRRTGHIRVGKV